MRSSPEDPMRSSPVRATPAPLPHDLAASLNIDVEEKHSAPPPEQQHTEAELDRYAAINNTIFGVPARVPPHVMAAIDKAMHPRGGQVPSPSPVQPDPLNGALDAHWAKAVEQGLASGPRPTKPPLRRRPPERAPPLQPNEQRFTMPDVEKLASKGGDVKTANQKRKWREHKRMETKRAALKRDKSVRHMSVADALSHLEGNHKRSKSASSRSSTSDTASTKSSTTSGSQPEKAGSNPKDEEVPHCFRCFLPIGQYIPGRSCDQQCHHKPLVEMGHPEAGFTVNHSTRKYKPVMATFTVPNLEFLGVNYVSSIKPVFQDWPRNKLVTLFRYLTLPLKGPDREQVGYSSHLGIHYQYGTKEVRIPSHLPDELATWWIGRARTVENFMVSIVKCQNMCDCLSLPTALDYYNAKLYTVVLALRRDPEHECAMRIVNGDYWFRETDYVTSGIRNLFERIMDRIPGAAAFVGFSPYPMQDILVRSGPNRVRRWLFLLTSSYWSAFVRPESPIAKVMAEDGIILVPPGIDANTRADPNPIAAAHVDAHGAELAVCKLVGRATDLAYVPLYNFADVLQEWRNMPLASYFSGDSGSTFFYGVFIAPWAEEILKRTVMPDLGEQEFQNRITQFKRSHEDRRSIIRNMINYHHKPETRPRSHRKYVSLHRQLLGLGSIDPDPMPADLIASWDAVRKEHQVWARKPLLQGILGHAIHNLKVFVLAGLAVQIERYFAPIVQFFRSFQFGTSLSRFMYEFRRDPGLGLGNGHSYLLRSSESNMVHNDPIRLLDMPRFYQWTRHTLINTNAASKNVANVRREIPLVNKIHAITNRRELILDHLATRLSLLPSVSTASNLGLANPLEDADLYRELGLVYLQRSVGTVHDRYRTSLEYGTAGRFRDPVAALGALEAFSHDFLAKPWFKRHTVIDRGLVRNSWAEKSSLSQAHHDLVVASLRSLKRAHVDAHRGEITLQDYHELTAHFRQVFPGVLTDDDMDHLGGCELRSEPSRMDYNYGETIKWPHSKCPDAKPGDSHHPVMERLAKTKFHDCHMSDMPTITRNPGYSTVAYDVEDVVGVTDMTISFMQMAGNPKSELERLYAHTPLRTLIQHFPMKDVIKAHDPKGWYRDLTREGVEPNPGPAILSTGGGIGVTRGFEPGVYFHPRSHQAVRVTDYIPLVNSEAAPPKILKAKAKVSQKFTDSKTKRANLLFADDTTGGISVTGFDTGLYCPNAFASNSHNELDALRARVLAATPEPQMDQDEPGDHPDGLDGFIAWVKKYHKRLLPRLHKVKPWSFEDYIKNSNASPAVKAKLRDTKARLTAEGIDEWSQLPKDTLWKWTTRSSFVKVEANLYQSPLGRLAKSARLIQGGAAEFIVLVGPWIAALQAIIKRRYHAKNNFVFVSGMTSEKAASDLRLDGGRLFGEDDVSKWDTSIHRKLCQLEVWLCKQWGAPRAVLDLMTANIDKHGFTLFNWKYKVPGTRASGDPYTSLFNSLINLWTHAFIFYRHHLYQGKSEEQAMHLVMTDLKMLAAGDDNMFSHSDCGHVGWRMGMLALGFTSEAFYRDHIHQLEFCSNRLYDVGGGKLVFAPKPGRVLAKFGYIVNAPKNVSKKALIRGVALGLLDTCHFIPPLMAAINRVLELTENTKAYYLRDYSEFKLKMRGKYEVTPEIWAHLGEQYGWDPWKQQRFEWGLQQMKLGDSYHKTTAGPLADLLFDRDTSAPQVIFSSAA